MSIEWAGALVCIAGIFGYICGRHEVKQSIRLHCKFSSMPYFISDGKFLKPGGEYYLIKELAPEEARRLFESKNE